MNAIFITQSSTLNVYYKLLPFLSQKISLDNIGFYISESGYYQKFLDENPGFEQNKYNIIKEWEYQPDDIINQKQIDKISQFEKMFGVPSLWDAIVSDRRIINGPNFTFRQDYKTNFNYEECLSLLYKTLINLDELFKNTKPDFISCFICTTVAEYLASLFAKYYNIPFLNLRPTRILNYQTFGYSVYEPSELIENSYKNISNNPRKYNEWLSKATAYINNSRENNANYEGIFLPSQRPPQVGKISNIVKLFTSLAFKKIPEIIKTEYNYRVNKRKYDLHIPGAIKPLFYWNLFNPILSKKLTSFFNKVCIDIEKIDEKNAVLFPLHKEPEVTLMVYSRYFMNQIEVIRNIAFSLPIGTKLIVKEHPASVGTRPISYYKKILNIPNVVLTKPNIPVRELIKKVKLIITIAGSAGIEALLLKKPVITFGKTPYEILPDKMVIKIKNINKLSNYIVKILDQYEHDESALKNYVAATMKESVPIDFYSGLLGRTKQLSIKKDVDIDEDLSALADYTIYCIRRYSELQKI